MIILLKWHEIHDNGLSSSSVTTGNLSSMLRIPHPEQHQSGKTNPRHWILTGILIFPRKSGVLGSVTRLDPLVHPKEPTQTCSNRERTSATTNTSPCSLRNDLRTTGSRFNLHFTSKKKGEVHTWGENGVNNNYLKPGFHHSDPQLPPACGWGQRALQAHSLCLTAQPGPGSQKPWGSRGRMEAVRSYTGWVCRTQLLL